MTAGIKRLIAIILAVAVLLGLLGLALSGRPVVWQPVPAPAHPRPVTLQGQVQAAESTALKAPATGKVVALGASEKLQVTAGQLIMQIGSPQARQAVRTAQAQLRELEKRVGTREAKQALEKIRLAREQLDSVVANRKSVEQQLVALQAEKPEVGKAAEALATAEQQATVAAEEDQAAAAARDAAQSRADVSGVVPPELEALRKTFAQKRGANADAQVRLNDARQAAQRLHSQHLQLVRQSNHVANSRRLEQQYASKLKALEQTPQAQAALHGDELLKAAREKVASAEKVVGECAISAPEAGVLAEVRVRPGATVEAGQTVAVIERLGGARLALTATAAQAQAVSVGQKARITPAGGRRFVATVTEILTRQDGVTIYLQPSDARVSLPTPGTAVQAKLL